MRKYLNGITLIEVLIAAGVLSLILGSTVALGRSVTRNQIITQDRAQALALAVEAVEIIRNLRDSTYIDQIQNRFNDFMPEAACQNKSCQNLEILWNTTINNWVIEDNQELPNPNPGEGGSLPVLPETDNDPTAEVITVNISTGDISDNTSRVELNKFKDSSCASQIVGSVVFCRKISLTPLVYDDNNLGDYNPNPDEIQLPAITEEDPQTRGSDPNAFVFDAFINASSKVVSEVSWSEFGQSRTVESTDIITNWQ